MSSPLLTSYAERLTEALPRVREQIARAEAVAGRAEGSVRLIAVTKSHPLECVEAALGAGLRDLGENRIEELEAKVEHFGADTATWHMIGHLQSRKTLRAIAVADILHSIDSLKLARKISAAECGRPCSGEYVRRRIQRRVYGRLGVRRDCRDG
jgi:uncharacterized pyridoxal phosphate-containing UPF0001 family protein